MRPRPKKIDLRKVRKLEQEMEMRLIPWPSVIKNWSCDLCEIEFVGPADAEACVCPECHTVSTGSVWD